VLDTSSAGALVIGAPARKPTTQDAVMPPTPPAIQRVRVESAFYFQGKALAVGSELDLPRGFAAEMRHAHKVSFVQPRVEPPAAPAAPVKTDPDAKPKGGKDAA
jgi:hypothetical protein